VIGPRSIRLVLAAGAALAIGCGRLGYDPVAGDGGGGAEDAAAADASRGGGDGGAGIDAAVCGLSCTTQGVSVAGDDDDGTIRGGELVTGGVGGEILMGRFGGDTAWGYYRFRLVAAIPAGANVVDARIELRAAAASGWSETAHQLLVMAEDTANAAVVTSFEERPDGPVPGFVRFSTGATVRWNPAGLPWPIGATVTSPNIRTAIQELVDRYGGLAQNAFVQIWIRGDGFDVDATVSAADSSDPGSPNPRLTIAFVPP
jgi:hypothetical protein